jgi:hypothetical protein
VQSFGDTIEAAADFNLGKAANVAGAEALGDTAGDFSRIQLRKSQMSR